MNETKKDAGTIAACIVLKPLIMSSIPSYGLHSSERTFESKISLATVAHLTQTHSLYMNKY